jgi:hypothetical protein
MILAQVGYDAPTLEWLVGRSDVIVRASVAEVSKHPLPDNRAWNTVTLKLHETLKGKPPETIQFADHSLASDRRYEGWKDAGREFLVFLLQNPQYQPGKKELEARFPLTPWGEGWTMFRLGPPVGEEKSWTPLPAALFRSNLDVLEIPAEILEATRRAVTVGGSGAPRMHKLSLPRSVMQWSGRSGDVNDLTVPVDSHLETLAKELIHSPDDVLSKRGKSTARKEDEIWRDGYWFGRLTGAKDDDERRQIRADRDKRDHLDRDELRVAGVHALAYFKSKENVALLKSLLNDEVVAVRVAAANAIGKE